MPNHPHIERGHTIAHAVIVVAFRIACAVLFLPVAWHELMQGETIGAVIAAFIALCLPSIIAPHKGDS